MTGTGATPSPLTSRAFWKLSGSGNDFVVFDARDPAAAAALAGPELVRRLCARGTGVGADGVVLLTEATHPDAAFGMVYFNSDGSRGEMCGNAALCATRMALELSLADPTAIRFSTDAGLVRGRIANDGRPEIELASADDFEDAFAEALQSGESRIGFGRVGVPHLVVMCDDVEAVDVQRRGRALRHHRALQAGANANFVSRTEEGGWRIRTYERGVEGETLACGTGATAAALLLERWGEAPPGEPVRLRTRSGLELVVTPGRGPAAAPPRLRGSARIVFRGELNEV